MTSVMTRPTYSLNFLSAQISSVSWSVGQSLDVYSSLGGHCCNVILAWLQCWLYVRHRQFYEPW